MKRAEVLEAYKVNEYGIIQSPGKFEAEMLYVPHFYEVALNGSTDTIYFGEDERIDIVPIDAEDATEFPELTSDVGKFAANMRSDLPTWSGASECYSRAYRLLEKMAREGHAKPAMVGRKGRILQPGSVSEDMRSLIDALNLGDEERIKAWLMFPDYHKA